MLRAHADDLNARLTAEMDEYVAHVRDYLANRARIDVEREARYRAP